MMNYTFAAFADEAASLLSDQIQILKEHQIPYLEIRGVNGTNIADLTTAEAIQIHKALSDAGISVWSLGSPYGKISITDPFEEHLEQFRHGLELAHLLGAEHIRLFSFYCPPGQQERYSEEVMHRLEQFITLADHSGIVLCHENEKGIYGDTALRCQEIHQNFPTLKAVFDPANFIQCNQDTIAAWEMLSPYVEYMHIKDARPDGSVVPAGKGNGQLPYLLKHYTGKVLSLEPHLSVFEGFSELEQTAHAVSDTYCYPTPQAAFDAAFDALKHLL